MTSHHGCQQILIGVFDFMIKSEIFSNCWILMPGIISTIVDLTHVTWIIVTSIHWLEFSGFNRSCVQETGHFNLFISDSVGIVVSIVRSTLPVLLTLPALFGAWVCTPFACFFMMMPAVILITPFVEIILDTVMFH